MSMISYPRSQEVRATNRNNYSKQSFSCFENILSIQTRASMLAKEGLMEQDSHNASKKASTTKKIPQSLTRLNAHKTTCQIFLCPLCIPFVHVHFNGLQ